jgi:membrane protein implicated in regulation of membrane protease activity
MTKRILLIFIIIVGGIALLMNKLGYTLAETVSISLNVLMISFALSLAFALPIFVLYLPPILHKKTRLDTAKQIMEDNIQVVEEASTNRSKRSRITHQRSRDKKTSWRISSRTSRTHRMISM